MRTGLSEEGKIVGHFEATGMRPRFLQHLETQGVKLPADYFNPSKPL